jgi:hypothetical protein
VGKVTQFVIVPSEHDAARLVPLKIHPYLKREANSLPRTTTEIDCRELKSCSSISENIHVIDCSSSMKASNFNHFGL